MTANHRSEVETEADQEEYCYQHTHAGRNIEAR